MKSYDQKFENVPSHVNISVVIAHLFLHQPAVPQTHSGHCIKFFGDSCCMILVRVEHSWYWVWVNYLISSVLQLSGRISVWHECDPEGSKLIWVFRNLYYNERLLKCSSRNDPPDFLLLCYIKAGWRNGLYRGSLIGEFTWDWCNSSGHN